MAKEKAKGVCPGCAKKVFRGKKDRYLNWWHISCWKKK